MRIDSPTNIRVTSDLSGSFKGSFSGSFRGVGDDITRIDTANITLKNGTQDANTTFQEQVEDIVDDLLTAGSGIGLTYTDESSTLEITNTANKFNTIRIVDSVNGTDQSFTPESTTDTFTITAGTDIALTSNADDQVLITGTAAPNDGTLTITTGTGLQGGGIFTANDADDVTANINIDTGVLPRLGADNTFTGTNTFNAVRATVFEGKNDTDTQITMNSDLMTLTVGNDDLLTLDEDDGEIAINADGIDIDTKILGSASTRLFFSDASANALYLGNLFESTTDSENVAIDDTPPARVCIVNTVASTKVAASTIHHHELLLVNYANTSGTGIRGSSIAFTGPSNGALGGSTEVDAFDGNGNIYRAHAAIAGIQTNTETDHVGLSFLTHNDTTSVDPMQESARLTHDGNLHVESDVIAFSTTVSDRRLKKNIKPLTNSLETICKLNGKTFEWIDGKRDGIQIGLIAQEVEEIIPEVINRHTLPVKTNDEETEYLTIQYDQLIPHLIESIKELQSQVNELRSRLGDN